MLNHKTCLRSRGNTQAQAGTGEKPPRELKGCWVFFSRATQRSRTRTSRIVTHGTSRRTGLVTITKYGSDPFKSATATGSVAALRDERQLRWERFAARVFGDARRVEEVRSHYDQAHGPGASARSYTGRGRRFPEMEP